MVIEKLAARAMELTGAYGVTGQHPDQVDAVAIAQARCTLIKQSLELFTMFCYQQNAHGVFVNLSGNTTIPTGVWTPWGSAGKPRGSKEKQRAQLTKDERLIVRTWLISLKRERRFPVFFYHQPARRWHVDTTRYHDLSDAIAWLERNQLDANRFVQIKNSL